MKERYIRNIPAISESDMEKLHMSHILVVGCGGLGGYIIEYLARIGVGTITLVDGDIFSESNLNRQILCKVDNIGSSKAQAAAERIAAINPDIAVIAVSEFLTTENADDIVGGVDLIIDALDNVDARFILEDAASKANVPIVHGAIDGWNIQAMLVKPGSNMLHQLYGNKKSGSKTVLAFTPAVCAGMQVSTAVQYLLNGTTPLDGKLFFASLKDMDSETIDLDQ